MVTGIYIYGNICIIYNKTKNLMSFNIIKKQYSDTLLLQKIHKCNDKIKYKLDYFIWEK